jgi:hypothetical protein
MAYLPLDWLAPCASAAPRLFQSVLQFKVPYIIQVSHRYPASAPATSPIPKGQNRGPNCGTIGGRLHAVLGAFTAHQAPSAIG